MSKAQLAPAYSINAAPDSANSPYPLVVFSHGRGAGRFMTAYFCEHLASYGFVVIAVEHVGSALRDSIVLSEEEFAANFIPGHAYRPQDIQRAIDYAETLTAPGGELEGIIDTERIAVSGWSFGGYAALVAAGARLNFDALAEWCAEDSEEESTGYTLSCSLLGQEEVLANLFGWSAVPEGMWPAINDPRVDALVALAPGRGPVFGPDGLAAVNIPALVLIGTRDSLDGMEDNAQLAYENFASEQKSLVVFENADHFIYGQCGPVWEQVIFPMCSDAVWDMARAQDLINHFTTAFLLATLKGDMDAASALALDAVQYPGISYETTGY